MQADFQPPTSRPERAEPCLGCHLCFLFDQCGGIYDVGVFDCLDYCCGKPEKCPYTCPKSSRFVQIVRDTGGLAVNGNWDVSQRAGAGMPEYVPCIHHGSSRQAPLNVPIVVLPTFEVTPRKKPSGQMYESPEELRSAFKIATETRIVLSSIAEDGDLENFWRVKSARHLAEKLALLSVDHIIAPNFSLQLRVPRFDNIANIRRSLLCAEELSRAGMSVIPYLGGVTQRDWDFWTDFMREHPTIRIVAKEFQTGAANVSVANWHIDQLLRLQDKLGRGLHLVAVGGRRHVRELVRLSGVTLVNSDPFMKTCYRQLLLPSGRWVPWPTSAGALLDEMLQINIMRYEEFVQRDLARARTALMDAQLVRTRYAPLQLEFAFAAARLGSDSLAPQLPFQELGESLVLRDSRL